LPRPSGVKSKKLQNRPEKIDVAGMTLDGCERNLRAEKWQMPSSARVKTLQAGICPPSGSSAK